MTEIAPKQALQRVTMADVARHAGVSTATVSFVLNAKKPVTPEVSRRVQEAVTALGYQPSHAAQTLRTGRSATLGLIIPDLTNPFFPKLAQDLEQIARERGYALLLADSHEDATLENELIQNLERRGVDALIIVPVMGSRSTLSAGVPVVVLDRLAGDTPAVFSEKYGGGVQAATHLLELGHREFAVLAGPARNSANGQQEPGMRVQGMLDTLRAAGASIPERRLVFGEYSVESGRDGTRTLLKRDPAFTALLAANDTLALGALSALQDAAVAVPDSVSLIGFDDIFWAALSNPPLTTVRQDTDALARQALSMAVEHAHPGQSHGPVATHLVVRASTGAPRTHDVIAAHAGGPL